MINAETLYGNPLEQISGSLYQIRLFLVECCADFLSVSWSILEIAQIAR